MTVFRELEAVVLTGDIARYGLVSGDLGTVVYVHDRGAAYEVEFLTGGGGSTVAVVTLGPDQIRAPADGEILHLRRLETA